MCWDKCMLCDMTWIVCFGKQVYRILFRIRYFFRVRSTIVVMPVPSQVVKQVAVGRVHDPSFHQLKDLHHVLLGLEDDMFVCLHYLPLAHFVAHNHDVSSQQTEVRHSAEKRQILGDTSEPTPTSAKPRQK